MQIALHGRWAALMGGGGGRRAESVTATKRKHLEQLPMRERMPRECTNGRSSKLACIHWSNQLVALEGLLCMLRPSQGGNSLNYPFLTAPWRKKEYDTNQLRIKVRKDCLKFFVDDAEQVQKTPGRR